MDLAWKSEVDRRLNQIEQTQAVHNTKIEAIEKKLDKIDANVSKLLWLVLAAVLGAVLRLVVVGGI